MAVDIIDTYIGVGDALYSFARGALPPIGPWKHKNTKASVVLPELLTASKNRKLYTLKDVCEKSKQVDPSKKAALVVVKTHYCDAGSKVCVKALANVSDKANVFVQKNFVTFHSRFWHYDVEFDLGEDAIRAAWDKDDKDPEAYVVDVNRCEIIFREYLYEGYGVYDTDKSDRFLDQERSFIGMRQFLLKSKKVRDLLDLPAETDADEVEKELAEMDKLREQYPQPPLDKVLELAEKQGIDAGQYTQKQSEEAKKYFDLNAKLAPKQ